MEYRCRYCRMSWEYDAKSQDWENHVCKTEDLFSRIIELEDLLYDTRQKLEKELDFQSPL